jgi:hypothetical protein
MANDTMTYGGIDYSTYGFLFGDHKITYMTPNIFERLSIPGGYGELVFWRGMEPLVITLTDCRIAPPLYTGYTLQQTLNLLSSHMWSVRNTDTAIILGMLADRYWNVRPLGPIIAEQTAHAALFELNFLARDPRAYALTSTQIDYTWEDTSDITKTFTTTGSAPSEPVVRFRMMEGAESARHIHFTITPSTGNVSLTTSMHQGQWLKFDCRQDQQIVYKSSNYPTDPADCVWVSCMDTVSGLFPHCDPLTSNTVTITGMGGAVGSRIIIDYQERYFA